MIRNEFVILRLALPAKFLLLIKEEIEEEIDAASKKWMLNLYSEERAIIEEMSIAQLRKKIVHVCKHHWDLSDSFDVSVKKVGGNLLVIPLPEKENQSSKLKNTDHYLRTKDGWEVDYEKTEASIPHENIYEKIAEDLKSWARVAAYYGTASFSGND